MKNFFIFTNSVDPDEMQHNAAFHLGLHCLHKYSFRGFTEYKGLRKNLGVQWLSGRVLDSRPRGRGF